MSIRFNLSLKYIFSTTLILVLVMGTTFGVIYARYERLVLSETEMQAKALLQQVVITRRWIADHGGVFVEQLPWVKPNPYLPHSTIIDVAGKRYVKENPAMVTKQLSLYAQKEGLYFFHITSLKLLNPENAPDAFELRALKEFETKGVREATEVEKIGNSTYFRYMRPLSVEKACLQCHAGQGYEVGDIRGGISVAMPMDRTYAMLRAGRTYMLYGGLATIAVLMAALYWMTRRMVIAPIHTMRASMARFAEDGSAEIPVLRTGDEIEGLSRSFVEMAKSIDEYHSCLQDKVDAATRELTATNENLHQRTLRKSDFIAKLSHELRSPLTAIKGSMDYLSVKLSQHVSDDAQDLIVFFEVIKKNADRLIRLVNSVLDYERIELGKFEMNFQDVNLKKAFQDVITAFKPLAEEKNVLIRLKAMEVTASADEDRIKQVLTNLISNALNFSAAGSSILVTLECRDEFVHAAVEDRGSGIPEAEREMLFRQFYTKDVKDGTGLGLAICKGIIEAHDGAIGVESGHPGGSRFWFTLVKDRKDGSPDEKETACH